MSPRSEASRSKEKQESRYRALVAQQLGAITRSQLTALEFTRGDIQGLLARGQLRRARPRVYVATTAPSSWEQKVTVAWLWAGPGAVISHRTAGSLMKLD
ncbi:MAG: hypothetical protein M3285_00725 [Actinomycetota bacterium]|nr:hypothetical protein [Actinomycetota bacterium]